MNNLKQYEKDETSNLLDITVQCNNLHARMGGRDNRPERVCLVAVMALLTKCIAKYREQLNDRND